MKRQARHIATLIGITLLAGPVLSLYGQDDPGKAKDEKKHTELEVTVTATRAEWDVLRTPSQVTILNEEDIKRSAALTLPDLMKGMSGLFVTENSSTPQDATIDARGFNNGGGNGQRLLVLVDGRKQNNVTGSSTDWAQIPLENIERIEIVRGPLAFLYGDGAVGGVVHIITKKGKETPRRSVTAAAGSYGFHKEFAEFSGVVEGLEYSLFGGTDRSDGYRDNSAYQGQNYTLSLATEIATGTRLVFKAGFHDDERERPGTLTRDEIESVGRDGSVTLGDKSDVTDDNFSLGIETALAGGAFSAFFSYAREDSDSIITYASGTNSEDATEEQYWLKANYVRDAHLLGLKHQIVTGVDLGWEEAEADALNDFPDFFFVEQQNNEYRRRMLGAFFFAETELTPSLLLSEGVRYDRAIIELDKTSEDLLFLTTTEVQGTRTYDYVNPYFGITYLITDLNSVYASWSRTFRYPNRNELIGFLSTSDELVPERASVVEIGVKSRAWKVLTGGITFYRMDVNDEIFFDPPATGAIGEFGQNENFPKIRHEGISIELESRPSDAVRPFIQYAYTKTVVEDGPFEGNDLPITPLHSGSVGVTVTPVKGLQITPVMHYVGSRYLLNDLDNQSNKLGGYTVTDVKASYQIGQGNVFLQGNNIFGKEYFDNGGIGGSPWGSRQAFNPAPEANFLIGLEVAF